MSDLFHSCICAVGSSIKYKCQLFSLCHYKPNFFYKRWSQVMLSSCGVLWLIWLNSNNNLRPKTFNLYVKLEAGNLIFPAGWIITTELTQTDGQTDTLISDWNFLLIKNTYMILYGVLEVSCWVLQTFWQSVYIAHPSMINIKNCCS